MAIKKIGKQTIKLDRPPAIVEPAAIVGPKEGQGPLSKHFDVVLEDDLCGEKSYEKAECKMVKDTAYMVIDKSKLKKEKIDYMLSGDLLNQIITSSFFWAVWSMLYNDRVVEPRIDADRRRLC